MISTPEQTSGATLWDRFTAPTERFRRPFRTWRRGRPFFPGLSILFAGLDIYYWPHSSVGKMLSMGLPGISSVFIAVFLAIFAVTVWFFPTYRFFSGVAAIMLSLLSLVATNLGGFFIGFLCGMLGGAFAVAWTPRADYTAETRRQRRNRLAAENAGLATGETVAAVAAPDAEIETAAGSPAADQTEVLEPRSAEYVENTQIIEQAARSGENGPTGTEPTTEKE